MKCPVCGAGGRVLETRQGPYGTTRRRRECDNMHRFATFEVYPQVLTAAGLDAAATARAVERRKALWRRNARIVRDPRPATVVGQAYGISATMVRNIRKSHA